MVHIKRIEGLMKKLITNTGRFSCGCAFLSGAMLMVALMATPVVNAAGPSAVNLGSAGNFAILAKTGISTTGTTSIVGDIGVSPAAASYVTGFALIADASNTFSTSPGIVTGSVYAADYAPPTPTMMTTAISDMETAYTDAAGRSTAPVTELGAGDITSMILAPGLYKWGTGVLISAGGVTLSGTASDVWIFQIAQNLSVSNGAIVTLSGGALAKNIFWQVAGQVTIGTTAAMKGNILCQTLIELQTGATLNGRALAQTAVTLEANSVTKPATDITSSEASKLGFEVQPGNTAAGSIISPAVTVKILDATNNLMTGDTRNITIELAANSSGGVLSGTTTVAAVSGVATFNNLSINKTGMGYFLGATSPALTGAISSAFNIIAGQATKVRVETAADGSGTVITEQNIISGDSLTVYAITRDANDNFVGNVAAESWELANVTGGIVSDDLVQSEDKKSAVFTAHTVGAAEIKAISGLLVAIHSGIITVSGLEPPSNLIVSDVPDDQGHSLKLTWTASPSESSGKVSYYRIYRSLTSALSDSVKPVNMFTDIKDVTAWERHAAVLVDSTIAGKTEFTDNAVGLPGVPYYYWIQTVGAGGVSAKITAGMLTVAEERNVLPVAFRLGDARPNPFNPSTTIEYSLPRNSRVILRVYNISGQKVDTLIDGTVSAGDHFAVWNATGMPSGVYFYSLRAEGGYFEAKKVMLLK